MYRGYRYDPEVMEDEDTRRYHHEVYQGKTCVGAIQATHWCEASYEDFQSFVDDYLLKNA